MNFILYSQFLLSALNYAYFQCSVNKKNNYTNKTGVRSIGIVDGALEEVVVKASDVVVSLDLAAQVMAVESEGADVLPHLLHGFQRLDQLNSLVHRLLRHRHRLPRRH
nr:hypothetical protein Iba_chr08aCG11510 [Ipomoea batatas]